MLDAVAALLLVLLSVGLLFQLPLGDPLLQLCGRDQFVLCHEKRKQISSSVMKREREKKVSFLLSFPDKNIQSVF